jgi:hypothetical protein
MAFSACGCQIRYLHFQPIRIPKPKADIRIAFPYPVSAVVACPVSLCAQRRNGGGSSGKDLFRGFLAQLMITFSVFGPL